MSGEKKEPIVKEVQDVKFYIDEKGETVAIGVPKKVKEIIGGQAGAKFKILGDLEGEISGEKYSEIDYHWIFLKEGQMSQGEVSLFTEVITNASGTIAVSTQTATTEPPSMHYEWKNCPECGREILKGSRFCNHCGAPISS